MRPSVNSWCRVRLDPHLGPCQSSLGPDHIQRVRPFGQPFFGPGQCRFGPPQIDIAAAFSGFRQYSHLVRQCFGKTAADKHIPFFSTGIGVSNLTDLQGGHERGMACEHAEFTQAAGCHDDLGILFDDIRGGCNDFKSNISSHIVSSNESVPARWGRAL